MKKRRSPRIDIDISAPTPKRTRLYVDEDVANVLRKIARAERVELGAFLEMLLRHWIRTERPQWKIVEPNEASASKHRVR